MSLSDLFSRRRKDDQEHDPSDAGGDAPIHPTKALSKFLTALGAREQPVVLDLGPVIGQNVTFFGEQLGCKIFVEDVVKDIERHTREGKLNELASFFATRFTEESDTFDGILCWDVFDYLDRPAAQALAVQMVRLLRPDGVLLGFFNSKDPAAGEPAVYTKHVVVGPATLRHKPYPAARGKQRPILNRDIIRMFEPLRVIDQFLLKTNIREVLLRKPGSAEVR
jgi:SAM-dependent methyltransferase